ncbi:hypothetical protein WL02_32470 [Burkholderia ubonensis]|nr:hypothetical protein WJ45_14050 [Burkholderia ubonensis]KVN75376.1 hypothetical protein WJ67_01430 [Burkholderia ubonensis]KVT99601.1 hypothetical protein WK61_07690 [Burkholderia ubonensis]KVX23935.1 hypothetical protein WL02_32470 [Burkholderia ubonensis]
MMHLHSIAVGEIQLTLDVLASNVPTGSMPFRQSASAFVRNVERDECVPQTNFCRAMSGSCRHMAEISHARKPGMALIAASMRRLLWATFFRPVTDGHAFI